MYSAIRSGGVADAVPDPRRGVWGGVYEVGPRGLARLDAREGHPEVYRRELATVWMDGRVDAPAEAWVYRVVHREGEVVPASPEYKGVIADGARKRGLPKAYIRAVIDRLPVKRRAFPAVRTEAETRFEVEPEQDGGLAPGWQGGWNWRYPS